MKLLLDTHVFLWFIAGNARLAQDFLAAIREPANEVFLSTASIWESVIKYRLGKLQLPESPDIYMIAACERVGVTCLSIGIESIRELAKLPLVHRDPFDRIIVAQAIEHSLKLVTVDPTLRQYPVDHL